MISTKPKQCLVIGDPVEHSLSPVIHNAGYAALGIEADFVYSSRLVHPENLGNFIEEIRTKNIVGVSCTLPHKVAVMQYLDEIDPAAQKIGAVNTIVNQYGRLKGYNTDWLGAVTALDRHISLEGTKVAVLGAGGAARAIVYGLVSEDAEVNIYSRSIEKAETLGREFGVAFDSFDNLANVKNMDIIVNATSVGLQPNDNKTPLPVEYIGRGQIIFDIIYTPYETRLLREAKERGASVIHGSEMLLQQGMAQFKLYNGYDAPEAAMRTALEQTLKTKEL